MFRVSGRALRILVGVLLAVVVLGGLFLAVLPEVGRRVAIAQGPRLTHPSRQLDDLNLGGNGLMFGPGARPGRLQLSCKLNDGPIALTSASLLLAPLAAKARATVDGFDVAPVHAYLPPSVPAAPRAGRVSLAVAAAV